MLPSSRSDRDGRSSPPWIASTRRPRPITHLPAPPQRAASAPAGADGPPLNAGPRRRPPGGAARSPAPRAPRCRRPHDAERRPAGPDTPGRHPGHPRGVGSSRSPGCRGRPRPARGRSCARCPRQRAEAPLAPSRGSSPVERSSSRAESPIPRAAGAPPTRPTMRAVLRERPQQRVGVAACSESRRAPGGPVRTRAPLPMHRHRSAVPRSRGRPRRLRLRRHPVARGDRRRRGDHRRHRGADRRRGRRLHPGQRRLPRRPRRPRRKARALMDQWGVGRKGFDDGLVDLLRHGAEPRARPGPAVRGARVRGAFLTNSERQSIFENDMLPHLRAADFDGPRRRPRQGRRGRHAGARRARSSAAASSTRSSGSSARRSSSSGCRAGPSSTGGGSARTRSISTTIDPDARPAARPDRGVRARWSWTAPRRAGR